MFSITNQEVQLSCIINYVYKREDILRLLHIAEEQMPVFLIDSFDNQAVFAEEEAALAIERTKAAQNQTEAELKNQDYLSCSFTGSSSFQIVRWVPMAKMKSSSDEINQIFGIGFSVILCLSVFLAFFAVILLYKPWKSLVKRIYVEKLEIPKSARNEEGLITHAFQLLRTKVNILQDTVNEGRVIAVSHFFFQLFKGDIREAEELWRRAGSCGLTFPHKKFLVFELRFISPRLSALNTVEYQFLKASLINQIKAASNGNCQYYPLETEETVITVLMHFELTMEQELRRLFSSIPDTEYLFPRTGCLAIKTDLAQVAVSKAEAGKAFEDYYLYSEQLAFLYHEENSLSFSGEMTEKWNGQEDGSQQ